MINFEFERKAFNDWHLLKYGEFVNWWDDTPASWIHNDRWEGWKSCAESKQAEIDSMKAQLSKVESGEFVVVPVRELKVILSCVSPDDMNLYDGVYEANEIIEKAMIETAQEQNND